MEDKIKTEIEVKKEILLTLNDKQIEEILEYIDTEKLLEVLSERDDFKVDDLIDSKDLSDKQIRMIINTALGITYDCRLFRDVTPEIMKYYN